MVEADLRATLRQRVIRLVSGFMLMGGGGGNGKYSYGGDGVGGGGSDAKWGGKKMEKKRQTTQKQKQTVAVTYSFIVQPSRALGGVEDRFKVLRIEKINKSQQNQGKHICFEGEGEKMIHGNGKQEEIKFDERDDEFDERD